MQKETAAIVAIIMFCVFASCGHKTEKDVVDVDSTSVSYSSSDSVLYGYAGMNCNDSTIDFIAPGSDPVEYKILKTKARGNIIGSFETGDKVAIVLSENNEKIAKAVDISSLAGQWLEADSADTPNKYGFVLNDDGSASTINNRRERLRYTKWDIYNANIVLTKQNSMLQKPVEYRDTFDIKSLINDTLVLRKYGEKESKQYLRHHVQSKDNAHSSPSSTSSSSSAREDVSKSSSRSIE